MAGVFFFFFLKKYANIDFIDGIKIDMSSKFYLKVTKWAKNDQNMIILQNFGSKWSLVENYLVENYLVQTCFMLNWGVQT